MQLLTVLAVVSCLLAALIAAALIVLIRKYRKISGELEESKSLISAQAAQISEGFRAIREDMYNSFKVNSDFLSSQISSYGKNQFDQLNSITTQLIKLIEHSQTQLSAIKSSVDGGLKTMQESNEKKLDQMRQTVDEKLSASLTSRLDSSFKQVGDQLNKVYQSLGEMQQLSSGVSDLNRLLTNVKSRGTWAEVQLGALLEQTLAPEQYQKNVMPNPSGREIVEYAIKLPGKEDEGSVWLPIDAKFPQEDYLRLLDASEKGDAKAVEDAGRALETRIKQEARSIQAKYISPPHTTDFAIMFLPTEGLYAEILRRSGIVELLQTHHRVIVAGPTTLSALLNSLSVGFKTLAIEKRTSEVWKLLSAVKTQYGTFTSLLEKTKRKLEDASRSIDDASSRSRIIQSKLKTVEALEVSSADETLGLGVFEDRDSFE